MSKNPAKRPCTKIAILGGIGSVLIYFLMINITLAHLESTSGMVPFDMRPFGYSPQEATDLLKALGSSGRTYYLTRQLPLDTLYPALLAITLIATNICCGAGLKRKAIIRVGGFFAVTAAVADYSENLGIALMIWNGPTPPAALVYGTSFVSILKAVATTCAVVITLLIVSSWGLRKLGGLFGKNRVY